jgi:glycerophosphoryl diester phosphodiesterase
MRGAFDASRGESAMRTFSVLLAIGFAAVSSLTALAADGGEESDSRPIAHAPIVIGHRGASGYRPEHTLASYELAIDLGADYVEPDVVSTRDGVLVARHENEIGGTTDVADHPEFADRRTTKTIDGNAVTGWFTEDFTLAELKTLRARERLPELRQRNTLYDGRYEIPTLAEVIALVKAKQRSTHRTIGLYPETKHPTYFRSIGLALEAPLVRTLHAAGYRSARSPVFIQSFEVGNLRDLSRMTRLPLVQLVDAAGQPYDFVASGDPRTYADLVTPDGLREIGRYAAGVGVAKNLIVPRDAAGALLPPTTLVADAHAAGLLVHAWTFRNENSFLPLDYRVGDAADPASAALYGRAFDEYALFFGLGLDGAFSDNPDTAVAARAALER